jgi:N4-gp56 family major capsid protein
MAGPIADFIPEIWSANILETLEQTLVYAGPSVVNRNYEGDIAQAGDTVHVTSFDDPTIGSYTVETNITVQSIGDDTDSLVVDQAKYFAFDVDDVIRRQALPGWVEYVTGRGGFKLASTIDSFFSGLMYTAVNGTANDLGDLTVDISDNNAYGALVNLRTTLKNSETPDAGRWVIVSPEFYAALLQDNRFIDASASGSDQALRNGFVGRAAGFDVFESTTVPEPTANRWAIIAGHNIATTYASQLTEVKAQERELRFGHLVKGLALYGGKVFRPENLAMYTAVVQA